MAHLLDTVFGSVIKTGVVPAREISAARRGGAE